MTLLNTNLNGFKNIASSLGDFTRSYMFAISIPAMGINDDTQTNTLTAFARSLELPSFRLVTDTIEFASINLQVVSGVLFNSPWSVEFLSDNNYVIRSSLLTWASLAWDINRKGASTPRSYKREASIIQLDRKGNSVCTYTMQGIVPIKVGGYELSNESTDFSRFKVDFAYDFYSIKIDRV